MFVMVSPQGRPVLFGAVSAITLLCVCTSLGHRVKYLVYLQDVS